MDLHDLIVLLACRLYAKGGKIDGRDLESCLEADWIERSRFIWTEDLAEYPEAGRFENTPFCVAITPN